MNLTWILDKFATQIQVLFRSLLYISLRGKKEKNVTSTQNWDFCSLWSHQACSFHCRHNPTFAQPNCRHLSVDAIVSGPFFVVPPPLRSSAPRSSVSPSLRLSRPGRCNSNTRSFSERLLMTSHWKDENDSWFCLRLRFEGSTLSYIWHTDLYRIYFNKNKINQQLHQLATQIRNLALWL